MVNDELLEAAEKSKILEHVILNEVKNLSIYAEERCFANAQHDRLGTFSAASNNYSA